MHKILTFYLKKVSLLAVIIPLLIALTAGIIHELKAENAIYKSESCEHEYGKHTIYVLNTLEVKNMKRTEKQIETGKAYLSRYNESNAFELSDVYKTYSVYKKRAMQYCKEQAEKNGSVAKIISHNCNFFTVAYETIIDGIHCIRIETAYNTYTYPIE